MNVDGRLLVIGFSEERKTVCVPTSIWEKIQQGGWDLLLSISCQKIVRKYFEAFSSAVADQSEMTKAYIDNGKLQS